CPMCRLAGLPRGYAVRVTTTRPIAPYALAQTHQNWPFFDEPDCQCADSNKEITHSLRAFGLANERASVSRRFRHALAAPGGHGRRDPLDPRGHLPDLRRSAARPGRR